MKKLNKVFLVVVIIFIAVLTTIVIKNINISKLKNAKKGNLDVNSELVQKLYSKILKSNDGVCMNSDVSFYKSEKTTLEKLNNEEKLVTVIKNLPQKENEQTNEEIEEKLLGRYTRILHDLKIYTKEEVLETAKEIFGENVELRLEYIDNGIRNGLSVS